MINCTICDTQTYTYKCACIYSTRASFKDCSLLPANNECGPMLHTALTYIPTTTTVYIILNIDFINIFFFGILSFFNFGDFGIGHHVVLEFASILLWLRDVSSRSSRTSVYSRKGHFYRWRVYNVVIIFVRNSMFFLLLGFVRSKTVDCSYSTNECHKWNHENAFGIMIHLTLLLDFSLA